MCIAVCARWRKSACTYCPFALSATQSRRGVLAEYQAAPEAGVKGLIMEHLAVSLNPRQGLIAGQRLADLLAATVGHEGTIAALKHASARCPGTCTRSAALFCPASAAAQPWSRQLRILRSGTRAEMATELAVTAARAGAVVDASDGIERMWVRRRDGILPAAEWFWVAAPAGAQEKKAEASLRHGRPSESAVLTSHRRVARTT